MPKQRKLNQVPIEERGAAKFGLVPIGNKDGDHEYDRHCQKLVTDSFTFLISPEAASDSSSVLKHLRKDVPNNRLAVDVNWGRHWYQIHSAFYDEAECLRREMIDNPNAVLPDSAHSWWRSVKGDFTKAIRNEGDTPDQYLMNQEIGAWAYACATAEYIFLNPNFDEERFLQRDVPKRACRDLVLRFYEFAHSRWHYHNHLLQQLGKKLCIKQGEIEEAQIDRRLSGDSGRPKGVEWEATDLWLILIWPIVLRYDWTYADALRAQRIFFAKDHPVVTWEAVSTRISQGFARPALMKRKIGSRSS